MPLSNEPPAPVTDYRAGAKRAATPPTPPERSADDDGEQRVDPRSVRAAQLSGAVASAVLTVLLLVAALALGALAFSGLHGVLFSLGVWLVLSAALTTLLLAWPSVRYRHTFYRISEQGLRIRRGVVWRTVSSVPRSRVQHTDVAQGPIERLFDLATLIVYTAGTHHASVSLSGLARDRALRIRDRLVGGGEDDAV
jgi:membrane protein YdbS with pleckstrin-like domain